jgi:hypothetical protein
MSSVLEVHPSKQSGLRVKMSGLVRLMVVVGLWPKLQRIEFDDWKVKWWFDELFIDQSLGK